MNKAMIIGYVGRDPELRYMPNGDAVVNVSVATTERWKDKQSGETQERTEWHRCNIFGTRAEAFEKYVKKGHRIYIEGQLQTRKWTDKEGIERYTTEIRVRDFEFLQSKGSDRPPHPADDPGNVQPSGGQAPDPEPQGRPAQRSTPPDFDDDIPF